MRTRISAAAETQQIYARVEHNVYLLLAAMLLVVAVTGIYLVRQNRRIFAQVAALSERRSELAQQLISMQENTLRYVSRELHDEFGQILTAIGAMLQRAEKRSSAADASLRADVREMNEIVQATLEKVRALSQALHPVVLEEGLESAVDTYLPMFEKQTGIGIHYEKKGRPRDRRASHSSFISVLQEALNNVARHSGSSRPRCACASTRIPWCSKWKIPAWASGAAGNREWAWFPCARGPSWSAAGWNFWTARAAARWFA